MEEFRDHKNAQINQVARRARAGKRRRGARHHPSRSDRSRRGRGGRTRIPPGARAGRRQPAARCSGMAACARSGGHKSALWAPLTFRSQRRAPLSTWLARAADPAVVVQPHAASGSFGDHHPKRPSLRAPPFGDADNRSARASADRSRHGGEAPDLHHGGGAAISIGVAGLLSRMLRQYPELGDAETGADRPGHPRAAQLLRVDRAFRSPPSSPRQASSRKRNGCWPRGPTRRR